LQVNHLLHTTSLHSHLRHSRSALELARFPLGSGLSKGNRRLTIILADFSALIKVLGHDFSLSNDQLGGTMIMHPNGLRAWSVKAIFMASVQSETG
jgi:hypothetical protein